jgi:ATP-dependent DNA helicase RecG
LFAKRLDAFDMLGRRAARVIVYSGTNKVNTQREQTGRTGYAVGFERLLEYVGGQIPSNEVVTQAIRKDVKMFPAIAVRELIANALVHQDFEQPGGILIEIYSNRLEVSNPGKPIIETDRFIDEYRSRSDRIADLARRLGMCEEKGSGIDKVIQAAELFQLPAPDFVVDSARTTAILFALRAFDDLNREARVRACYQHCCLRYVTREPMTNQSLRQRFQLSDQKMATISRVISDTVDAGKIRLEDGASGRKYAKYIPFWA